MKTDIYHEDGESIDLFALIKFLWTKKLSILIPTFLIAISSVIISLNIPNTYRAEGILIPSEEAPNLSSSFGALGGLASIAGIETQSAISKVDEGIAVIASYSFFTKLNENHNILPDLIAAKKWDRSKNKVIYDKKIYDDQKKEFIRDRRGNLPSLQLAHRDFQGIVSLKEDRRTGIVKLQVDHISPYVAADLANNILTQLNETLRLKELEIAERSNEFLIVEITKTELSEVKVALSQLIQQNTQKSMIANSTPEFLFNVIQNPYPPEIKFKPLRSIICIVSTILGFILSCSLVIFRNILKNQS